MFKPSWLELGCASVYVATSTHSSLVRNCAASTNTFIFHCKDLRFCFTNELQFNLIVNVFSRCVLLLLICSPNIFAASKSFNDLSYFCLTLSVLSKTLVNS